MIGTGIDVRVKIQDIVTSQLPEYIISESPLTDDFLKQFYISQEFQGGPVDFASNLDQYLKLDTFTENVVFDNFHLTESLTEEDTVVHVNTTKGFPNQYGLLKVDNEIMSYTGVTTNTFTGVLRGFSGITSYRDPQNPSEAYFETTEASEHESGADVTNLSTTFLKEFYNKIKSTFSPGFENIELSDRVSPGTWIRQARTFYQSKGSEESIVILFKVLFGEEPTVLDLERFLIKSSDAEFTRRDFAVGTPVIGNPTELKGRTIFQSNASDVFGAVSEIEPFTRDQELLYKIYLFVADDEITNERKLFTVPGRTFAQRAWVPGDTTITVDTTIGFRDNGEFITADGTKFTYTEKSVNQFLGVSCEDPDKTVVIGEEIVDDIYVYGFTDDGERVELRLTGTLSDITFGEDGVPFSTVGETILVDSLGENILPKIANRTAPNYADTVANSFIYNTSVRFQVGVINGTSFEIIASYLDDSYIRVNDNVDILVRGSNNVILANRLVTNVDYANATITIDDSFGIPLNTDIDLRRIQRFANATNTPIRYGNNAVLSNVQNLYDAYEYDENFYVATNSLPSYDIESGIVESEIVNLTTSNLEDFNSFRGTYSTIVFTSLVEFITGDLVTYSILGDAEPICEPGEYFVEVLEQKNKVRLYVSPSFIGGTNFVELNLTSGLGTHLFTLESQKDREIVPQNIFRKIPVTQGIQNIAIDRLPEDIVGGEIAVLTNGVVVESYISADSIYLGPLDSLDSVSGGEGYSPATPPEIVVADPEIQVKTQTPETVNATKAVVTPVIKAKLDRILIDPQEFDIDKVFSITVTGGNSTGASAIPQIERRKREADFDSRTTEFGGGVSPTDDSIQFIVNHNFTRGEKVVYNNKGSESIGVAPPGSDFASSRLANGGVYFAEPLNNVTIRLYNSFEDLNSGINTVGLSSNLTGYGVQSFDTLSKNTLTGATISEDGGEFWYRNMKFAPESVFIEYDEIRYENHGFSTGEVVEYGTTDTAIVGLSTLNSYYVVATDENTIKLCDAGIGATSTYNYERLEYVNFETTGVGTHSIHYPEIKAEVVVSFASTNTGEIVATPFLRGEIDSVYVNDGGFYGSDILNFEKNPDVDVLTGVGGKINPIVSLGRVVGVQILSKGRNYQSTPDVNVIDKTGRGSGAILRTIVEDGEIVDVVIIKGGQDYDEASTSVEVVDTGKNALLVPRIRRLRYNRFSRFGFESLDNNEYSVIAYGRAVREGVYDDIGGRHSPIVGWANDGNPIYGGYGYSDPQDPNSDFIPMTTAYELDVTAIEGRPSAVDFPVGTFIDDYKFTGKGDLDEYNGRYCRTPEFPNGVYAYFAGISTVPSSVEKEPQFPYFIGPQYRDSPLSSETGISQSFNLNDKPVFRNTQPYAVGSLNVGSEFLVQSYLFDTQETTIESIETSKVDRIVVVGAGQSYAVGDIPLFDTTTDVVSSVVSEVEGKGVVSIASSIVGYGRTDIKIVKLGKETVRVYVDPKHDYLDNDTVVFNGLSTALSGLTDAQIISIDSSYMTLYSPVEPQAANDGTADIFVNTLTDNFSIESNIVIGIGSTTQEVEVLNIFPINKAIRVRREDFPFTIPIGSKVDIIPDQFDINVALDDFESSQDYIYYFNPRQTIGVGIETGSSTALTYSIGNINYNISVPAKSIYAPNHEFVDSEPVIISKDNVNDSSFNVRTENGGSTVIPYPGELSSEVFITRFSKDYIGIKTTADSEPVFFGSNGLDKPLYNIRSNRYAERANVARIQAVVTTNEPHSMESQDKVRVSVKSKSTSGVGSNPNIFLQFDDISQSLIVDPKYTDPSNIDTATNLIRIDAHNYILGDYVLYENYGSAIAGIETHQKYFIIPFDQDRFQLAKTEADLRSGRENPIRIGSIGIGSHKFSKVNPRITVTRDNNIEFDVSDPSLTGKELKFFYDQDQTEIFESNGIDEEFIVSGVSTEGLPGATKNLKFSENNPIIVYYGIEEGGYISTSDTNPSGYNSIVYGDSIYSISARITKTGDTEFRYSLPRLPEKDSYSAVSNQIEYTTSSNTANGGIGRVRIVSTGQNFDSIPEFITVESEFGQNSTLKAESKSIGKVSSIRIKNPGWGYSADNTLRPRGIIQPKITFDDSDFVTAIEIDDAGNGYQNPPNAVLLDSITRDEITNGSITLEVQSSSISNVNIDVAPTGLTKNVHELYTINNSNGIPITLINFTDTTTGIVTFTLQTPIFNYSTPPFAVGDKVFVENIIDQDNAPSSNLNSADYGYKFIDVVNVSPPEENPVVVTLQYPDEAIGNLGIGATFQNAFSSMVNEKIYPKFTVLQGTAIFNIGERLSFIDPQGNVFDTDLVVTESNTNFFKVTGNFDILVGDSYKGQLSGVQVTVNDVENDRCRYQVDSVSRLNTGWKNETGFLNTELQVTPNNDYYQNLSYSVKSTKTFEEIISPLNTLVHPAGLKNFADTKLESSGSIGIAATSSTDITLDFIGLTDVAGTPLRVDRINNFDLGYDDEVFNNRSSSIRFNSRTSNKRLTDFVEVRTNRVLLHDDISNGFIDGDNARGQEPYTDFDIITSEWTRAILQARDPFTDEVELVEIIMIAYNNNAYTLQKANVSNNGFGYGEFVGIAKNSTEYTLRYTNTDIETKDLDFKLLSNKFVFDSKDPLILNRTTLAGDNSSINSGDTFPIFGRRDTDSAAAYIQIIDGDGVPYYYEFYTFILNGQIYNAVYSFDTESTQGYNADEIVELEGFVTNTGALQILCTNLTDKRILVTTKVTAFQSTSSGDPIYRFKRNSIPDGSERSINLINTTATGSSSATSIDVLTLDRNLFQSVRSMIYVSGPGFSAIHQVMSANSNDDTYVSTYPFLTEGSDLDPQAGIGSFGSTISGNDFILQFYPDAGLNPGTIEINAYHEAFYREYDSVNYRNLPLIYSETEENYYLRQYVAPLGQRTNKVEFELTYQGIPIYEKVFNPDNTISDLGSASVWSIEDHFFSPAEELYYEAGSSVNTLPSSPIEIEEIRDYQGNLTTTLPDRVWCVKRDLNRFQLAPTEDEAILPTGARIKVVNNGSGNAHRIGMVKKLEKTLITIDGVIQAPVVTTNKIYTLDGNTTADDEFMVLTGIGTIRSEDILKIDDEYVRLKNVGFATSPNGPIDNTGSFPLVEVERGIIGSAATSHTIGSDMELYRGSFNIIESKVVFTEAPSGRGDQQLNENNLVEINSSFQGRTFLQKEYDRITLFDDISDQFDGDTNAFLLSTESTAGITTEVENGSGVLIINDVYQTPTTDNNQGNNYFYQYNATTGINTVVFTGITSANGQRVVSEFDVNQNQIPRGGLIISVGSTPGLGYAPLYGAVLEPEVTNGVITDIISENTIGVTTNIQYAQYNNETGMLVVTIDGGSSSASYNVQDASYFKESGRLLVTSASSYGTDVNSGDIVFLDGLEFSCANSVAVIDVNNAVYDEVSGNVEITTNGDSNVRLGQSIRLENLVFECSSGGAPSQQSFPSGANGFDFTVGRIINDTTFVVNVGTSTLPHTYISSGQVTAGITTTIFPDADSSFIVESIVDDTQFIVNVGISTIDHTYVGGGTFETRSEFPFNPDFTFPDFVYLDNLQFSCPNGETAGLTTTVFPIPGEEGFPFVSQIDDSHFEIFVGISTIVHLYEGGGTIGKYRKNNPGSGYNSEVDILIYEDGHTGAAASVRGIPGPGGELSFTIVDGGSGYTDPQASAPEPNYANLPVIGYSRRTEGGAGLTTETGKNLFVTLEVGAATTTAIGRSEYFEVSNYELTNQGYSFLPGDVIEVVGLVTDKRLSAPLEPFQLTITETFTDNFAAWNFGETDYIDSIKRLQDGVRTRFPLLYNNETLAFEKNPTDEDSAAIDLSSILLIYVNTVLQVPELNYTFDGGTSFEFTRAPFPEDDIDIYFYRGKRRIDSLLVRDVNESIRPGDELQMKRNNAIPGTQTQDIRTVTNIAASDTVRTNTYFGRGDLDKVNPREVAWDKQKRDIFIYGEPFTKARDSIEPIIKPNGSIIRDFSETDNVIQVDNATLFEYEEDVPGSDEVLSNLKARIYRTVPAKQVEGVLTASVQPNGQLSPALNVVEEGAGYKSSTQISIAPPPNGGIRADGASMTVDGEGSILFSTVGNRGSGYDQANPPTVFIAPFEIDYEDVLEIQTVEGFSGIITSIEALPSSPVPNTKAIRFGYRVESDVISSSLLAGYSVSVVNTVVGNGVESRGNSSIDKVGVGTQFLDCVYQVVNHVPLSFVGYFDVVVTNTTQTANINVQGDDLGQFSWGRISVLRDIELDPPPIVVDGSTFDSQMSNYPVVTRTSGGLRDQGGIAKEI